MLVAVFECHSFTHAVLSGVLVVALVLSSLHMVDGLPKCGCCAFCYKHCTSDALMTCSGCKKRKYCSSECQRKDWSDDPSARGQRHKVMCGLACGEEGDDWEVRYLNETKGYGLVALREFSRGQRILAERAIDRKVVLNSLTPAEKVAMDDLMPKGGSLLDKLDTNALSTTEGTGGAICVRLVRANHACVPNACHYDEYKGIKLLVARTTIKAGEEITISYILWYNMQNECDATVLRDRLSKRDIHCSPSCECRDPALISKLAEVQELYKELKPKVTFVCGGKPVPRGKLDRLGSLVEELELSHVNVSAVCYAAHAEYLCRGDILNAAKFVQKSLDMNVEIYGPNSESAQYDREVLIETTAM